jgi:hypothetical protein
MACRGAAIDKEVSQSFCDKHEDISIPKRLYQDLRDRDAFRFSSHQPISAVELSVNV